MATKVLEAEISVMLHGYHSLTDFGSNSSDIYVKTVVDAKKNGLESQKNSFVQKKTTVLSHMFYFFDDVFLQYRLGLSYGLWAVWRMCKLQLCVIM